MVQIVANWAWLTGRLESMRKDGDHVELDVWIESTDSIENFPNLFQQYTGSRVLIKLSTDAVQCTPGNRISLKARMVGAASGWGDPATLKLIEGQASP